MQRQEPRQDHPQNRAPRQDGCQRGGGAAHDCRDCRGDCGGGVYFDDGRDGGERVDRRDVPGAGAGQQAREERETNDRVHLEIFERLDRLTERVTELEKKLRPAPAERAPAERAPAERRRIGR
ncbi:MAG: hypothetical protein FJ265_21410 [Planctomycetes bacterium]|nr:hypothetical protein [Planctomycetota bacterium]